MGWGHKNVVNIQNDQPKTINPGDQHPSFTILINTYKRHALLLQQLQLYTSCPAVAQVRVLWSESPEVPWAVEQAVHQNTPRVVLDMVWPNRSLNLRFQPFPIIPTEGVLVVDDDILVSCAEMMRTFEVCWGV